MWVCGAGWPPKEVVVPVLPSRGRGADDHAHLVGERRSRDVPRFLVRDQRRLVNPEDVESGTYQLVGPLSRLELDEQDAVDRGVGAPEIARPNCDAVLDA